ncbi:5'/3'-nucleotidase SurE [Streptomyces sp. NPDC051940]|uniref:5'/3'-nucleotidase SurE n=1 Tax=Streptomyces sp. NPDC051940 TaxID=3155675 RepID=UPI003441A530
MKHSGTGTMRRLTAGAAAVAAAAALLTASNQATAVPSAGIDRPLRILVSNDDGYRHPFIRALKGALAGSGHQVVIVAPADDQSGRGTGMNFTQGAGIRAAEEEPGVWSVTGSPGDAVSFGVRHVFRDAPPDLVVSGVNAGQNIGVLANHSGTVGATVTANDLGVPAIAVSAGFDLTDPRNPFPSLAQAAAFTARTVDRLARTAPAGELLPPGTALNINYPAHVTGGVAFTNVGEAAAFTADYVPDPATCATCYKLALSAPPATPEPVGNADTTALASGQVSVSLLTGDWGAAGWAAGRGGPTPAEVRLTRLRLTGLTP